jgi:hypothetical protein
MVTLVVSRERIEISQTVMAIFLRRVLNIGFDFYVGISRERIEISQTVSAILTTLV